MNNKLPARTTAPVWRIKVRLAVVSPVVWRRFDTDANITLAQLHDLIQAAMGWESAHLHSFEGGRTPGCELDDSLRLCDACRVGDVMIYSYDFGDDWKHQVLIEKSIADPAGTFPRMVAGANACPPEDCGGPWGYADMLKVLAGSSTRSLGGRG